MKSTNIITAFIVTVVLITIVVVGGSKKDTQEHGAQSTVQQQTSTPVQQNAILEAKAGMLFDVTNKEEVRGVIVENATGFAEASLHGNGYRLEAVFSNIPTPQNDDFYEGWIVRRGENPSVISTGVVELENRNSGEYSNTFTSKENLMDHDFYVLTLEPNDGDPEPADHILEGMLQ